MSKSNITAASIIIFIALGIIAYAGYQSYSQKSQPDTLPIEETRENPNEGTLITAKHQYNASTSEHIVAGTLVTPTICHTLETSALVDEKQDPVVATLGFNLISTAETCAQAIGEARFKINFEAPEDTTIQATLNGSPVELNLIPISEGEDISDFEIYIKG